VSSEQLELAGIPAPLNKTAARDLKGRYAPRPDPLVPGEGAEVATVSKGEFLFPVGLLEYPNVSKVIKYRAQGQGIRFYDTMLGTDPDLAGFFQDLNDDVLQCDRTVRAAGPDAKSQEHADFIEYVLERIPNLQNALRHFLDAHARGFSVTEKMYEVVDGGKYAGAVVYSALLDKPQRWFTFDPERNLHFRTYENFYPGELVPQEKFAVVVFGSNSDPWGRAILDLCYWPWFLKHHAMRHQALFFEKWGSPQLVTKYKHGGAGNEGANKANLVKALSVLASAQKDQGVAMPEGIDLSLLESTRSGTISFEQYVDQLTKMESRIVTGQVLASSGDKGGSYALGKVHETRLTNKVEMLADFLEWAINLHLVRDLIDRNFGPQDAYPAVDILARDSAKRQAQAMVEKAMLANGHEISKSWSAKTLQVVGPKDAGDKLIPPQGTLATQQFPISPTLAGKSKVVALAGHTAALKEHATAKAKTQQAKLDAIGAAAVKQARPSIRKIVKGIGSKLRGKKSMKAVDRTSVYGALKGLPVADLAAAFDTMFQRSAETKLTVPTGDPPDVSTAAKLALALQMAAIADRIVGVAADALEGMAPGAFADSLTDPDGVAVDEAFGNLFEGTHATNIASIATAKLRAQLDDPAFRKRFPYVMIVVTNPNARLGHRMMDGFILSAEDARYSPFLPPFDFGCDCQAVPISAAMAAQMGLTGAAPVGALDEFLQAKGAMPARYGPGYTAPTGEQFNAGAVPGFSPAFSGTDTYVQLQALRQKAEELRAEDPQAWVEFRAWLLWLFLGLDILREDPPQDEESAA
jgi:phage gp29-like protein